jgi:hypothetical protein
MAGCPMATCPREGKFGYAVYCKIQCGEQKAFMQTRDLEKNYEALGEAALDIVEECVTKRRGWEAARDVLSQIMDAETLGRGVEVLAESMELGDARDAVESSTMSKQAAVAMGEMFGKEPKEPAEHKREGVALGWPSLADMRELGASGEILMSKGLKIGQKRVSKTEWRMVAELGGWIIGARVERYNNGYLSARLCAYGKDEAARARSRIWRAEEPPMASWGAEGFFEPAAAQDAAAEALALGEQIREVPKGFLSRLRAI